MCGAGEAPCAQSEAIHGVHCCGKNETSVMTFQIGFRSPGYPKFTSLQGS
jgi:hypothetical protein